MSREHKIQDAMSGLRYNYPQGVTTWGDCQNKCGRASGRGSGSCGYCFEDELAKLTNAGYAAEFHDLIKRVALLTQEMIDSKPEK